MPIEYRHINQYKKEILQVEKPGLPKREIREKLGFSKEQFKVSAIVLNLFFIEF